MLPLQTQTILDNIVGHKNIEVARSKLIHPRDQVELKAAQARTPRDLPAALRGSGVQLIAEVKRASPSKGSLRADLNPVHYAQSYVENGAAAISVLTDQHFFKGSLTDLQVVCDAVTVPVLRKDFVFDPYQVYEARAAGADAVLLITSILPDDILSDLYHLINDLGMSALIEVHNAEELTRALRLSPRVIGINNRNLKTFDVSLNTTIDLVQHIPNGVVKVAESGIHTAQDVKTLVGLGVEAMLVGESIVTAPNAGEKVKDLCSWGIPHD